MDELTGENWLACFKAYLFVPVTRTKVSSDSKEPGPLLLESIAIDVVRGSVKAGKKEKMKKNQGIL